MLVGAALLGVLLILTWLIRIKYEPQRLSVKTRNIAAIVIALLVAQAAYTYLNERYFEERYRAMLAANTST